MPMIAMGPLKTSENESKRYLQSMEGLHYNATVRDEAGLESHPVQVFGQP